MNATLSSIQRTADRFIPSDTEMKFWRDFRDVYTKRRGLLSVEPEPRRVLFLSRQDAGMRRILNAKDLVKILERYNFKVDFMSFGNMKPYEVAKKIRSASLVLGAHGAGIVNIMFTAPETVLYEFHNAVVQRFGKLSLCLLLNMI